MKVLSKKSGIVYDNIVLVKFLDNHGKEEILDTYLVDDVDFNNYDFAYTCLCDDCLTISGKQGGVEGGGCCNSNCNSKSEVWEVTFSKDEIANDLVIIK